jgi:hypothetical protein
MVVYTYRAECEPAPRRQSGDRQLVKVDQPSAAGRPTRPHSAIELRSHRSAITHHVSNREQPLSGHSTRTAVITSRIPIADIAHLHEQAERDDTTVSALIARAVADRLAAANAPERKAAA